MPAPKAWILSIGNEVVSGQIVNTNGSWLARRLTMLGFQVKRIIALPDDETEVVEVFSDAVKRGIDVVISTGGLGPTYDDRTSEFIAKAIGEELVINEDALRMVEEKYRSKGLELTEHRIKMAKMPESAKPIPNPVGTAPGILVEKNDTLIIALPGVPKEMQAMFDETVEKILCKKMPRIHRVERWLHVEGIPESSLAPIIESILKKYPKVYIKSHPKGKELEKPVINIYVLAVSDTEEEARELVEKVCGDLVEELISLGVKVDYED